jgi:two-component system response regulator AtoC
VPPTRRSRLELAVLEAGKATVFPLPEAGKLSIGRAEENDISIPHPSISRRHAILHVGSSVWVEDLGSANGTFVTAASQPRGPDARTTGLAMERVPTGQLVTVRAGQGLMLGSKLFTIRPTGEDRLTAERIAARAPDAAGRTSGVIPVVADDAMVALYATAKRAAQSTLPVLILGETGVGKEILAETIHSRSARAKAPFLRLNCAALSESLLESELFGHEQGAFTGAVAAKPGLLESAQSGTVFLDEVGELPLAVQVKLLRVLEDHKVTRVGGLKPMRIDVRFVAATNRDLHEEMAAKRFRQDLFFRLNGIAFVVPPLRERRREIRPLAQSFAAEASRDLDRDPLVISPEALAYLESYDWPGNIRELRNVVERAVVLCQGPIITVEDLQTTPLRVSPTPARPMQARIATTMVTEPEPDAEAEPRLHDEIASIERRRIIEALETCAGNQTRAAQQLGISRRTMVARMDAFGLPRPRKR